MTLLASVFLGVFVGAPVGYATGAIEEHYGLTKRASYAIMLLWIGGAAVALHFLLEMECGG